MHSSLQRQAFASATRRSRFVLALRSLPSSVCGLHSVVSNNVSGYARPFAVLVCQQHPIKVERENNKIIGIANLWRARPFTLQTRGKKGGRKTNKLSRSLRALDERAHREEHEFGLERRRKKKEKDAIRKGKKGVDTTTAADVAADEDSTDMSSASLPKIEFDDNHDWEAELEEHKDEEEEEDILPSSDRVKERMQKVVEAFENSLRKIRGAEPTPELFDDVMVDAYGALTSLKTVAQVEITSPILAQATCYDPTLTKSVKTAISTALMLNPSVEDGGVVMIPLPRVSMETRIEATKGLKKRTEAFKIKVRKIRQKSLDVVKQGVAGKIEHVSKDDAFRVLQEIEKVTDSVIQKIEEMAKIKHDAIMKV